MRRPVLRILLNTATVLSLVLCVVTMAAWVRSYLACDRLSWTLVNPRLQLRIITYRGGLFAGGHTHGLRSPGVRRVQFAPASYSDLYGPQGTFFNQFGFALDNRPYPSPVAIREIACPYWFIMLLTAILPVARLVAWRRRRARRSRTQPSLCRHCGYDCRATPDRCPECGTPVAAG